MIEVIDCEAEEEQHVQMRTRDQLQVPGADELVERQARWAAATLLLTYLPKTGATTHAGECPDCECEMLFIHQVVRRRRDLASIRWLAYECARCGATFMLGDRVDPLGMERGARPKVHL